MSYSLAELREYVLRQHIRGYRTFTTGIDSGGGYVGTVAAAQTERRRMLLSSDLTDQTVVGGEEAALESTRYDNAWLYLPASTQQRRVPPRGYIGSALATEVSDQTALTDTWVGTFTVSRPFDGVVAANQRVELSVRLPIIDDLDVTGVNSLINRALWVMVMPSRITLVGASGGQNQYSLAAFPWLQHQDQLLRVLADEAQVGVEPVPLWGAHSIRADGGQRYLVTTGAPTPGLPFYADCWRPRGSLVKIGDEWLTSSVGLVNDSDEADVDRGELATVVYAYACDVLSEHGPQGERGMWAARREAAYAAAEEFMQWQRLRYDDPTDAPVRTRDSLHGAIAWP